MAVHETIDDGIAIITMDNPPVSALISQTHTLLQKKYALTATKKMILKLFCFDPPEMAFVQESILKKCKTFQKMKEF